ncbi:hypothetical protein NS365_21965 [Aureimonas ureilytica]|uniref:Uncharacterized protein n=1 Tax=Aureimonas ureilytica TaxID=401562 RepID=A0A175REQ4_9HYPH|nr:TAXI family TRAP transporter solute-binding subunit [Aureimonas ureilytica]KTR02280.1 hypothetical protein NS365_21965 [Aureimonas ureilytica]
MTRLPFLAAILAAAALLAPSAQAQDAPFRVCTARKDGNYFAFGLELQKTLRGTVPVEVIATDGSWDNLGKLKNGQCDAAIVQSDADTVFRASNAGAALTAQRIGAAFRETLNLVCNRSLGINDLSDFVSRKPKVAIGKFGSGSWVSWNGIVQADRIEGSDAYSAIPTETVGDTLALTQVVDGSDVGCLFFTSSKNSDFTAKIAAVAGKGKVLDFVDISDKDFNDTLDSKGRPIYEPTKVFIDGFGHWSSTPTYAVNALFFVSDRWAGENSDEFDAVVSAFLPTAANVKAARHLD